MVDQGTVVGDPTDRAVFVASQPIRLYVNPGPDPALDVERDSATELGSAYASISGQLGSLALASCESWVKFSGGESLARGVVVERRLDVVECSV